MKSFDIFNWWAKRLKLGELYHYLVKNHTKRIGDYLYKAGEKAHTLYFLRQGEIELSLPKQTVSRRFFQNKDKPPSDESQIMSQVDNFGQYKSEYTHFMRNIFPANVFGVEELLCDSPLRIFNAKVKSASTVIYELPFSKIAGDLILKNPTFYG